LFRHRDFQIISVMQYVYSVGNTVY
jgi:hypothetical protein